MSGYCKDCGEREVHHPNTSQCHRCYQRDWRKKQPLHNVRVGKRAEQKRRWDRENRERCECGSPMERGKAQCRQCWTREQHVKRNQRRRTIQTMWLTGANLRDIAAALDCTAKSVGVEMAVMRRDGWDPPYRYVMRDGRRVPGKAA